MTYTSKTISALFYRRLLELWTKSDGTLAYRILFENTTISPPPKDSETWLEMKIIFGDVVGKTIAGTDVIDRVSAIARFFIYVPKNNAVSELHDIHDLLNKSFCRKYWQPENVHVYPAKLIRKDKDKNDANYKGITDIPFTYDSLRGEIISTSLSEAVIDKISDTPISILN